MKPYLLAHTTRGNLPNVMPSARCKRPHAGGFCSLRRSPQAKPQGQQLLSRLQGLGAGETGRHCGPQGAADAPKRECGWRSWRSSASTLKTPRNCVQWAEPTPRKRYLSSVFNEECYQKCLQIQINFKNVNVYILLL